MQETIIKKQSLVLIKDLGMLFPTEISERKYRHGLYKCKCGVEFKATMGNVKQGNIQSCGCYKKEARTTHKLCSHPLYSVWCCIITRTTNENNKGYKNYGGRGIKLCDEWRHDFKAFFDFSMANGWEKSLEIDRINNDNGYSPDNCRFVAKVINARNTRILKSSNTSGYRGVTFNKGKQRWIAQINVNNKKKHIGSFKTVLEAAKAYDSYVVESGLEHTINGVLL